MATIGGRLTSQIYYFGARRLRARGSLLFVIPPAMCYRVYTYAYACTRGGGREGGGIGGDRRKIRLKNVTAGRTEKWPVISRVLSRGEPHRHLVHCQNWLMNRSKLRNGYTCRLWISPPPPVDWVGRPITGIRWKKKEKKEKRNEDASRINK